MSVRSERGLLDVDDVRALDAIVLDPYSLILSSLVRIGRDNVFYPNVVIECDATSTCEIGEGNVFWPGTVILASAGASIVIGAGNAFGPGGVSAKAHGSTIAIGSRTRLVNGAEVLGGSTLGDGCQILGPISAGGVDLGGGGDFGEPDPDLRGAVLKGSGSARRVTLRRGEVINGNGEFGTAPVERQLFYHPRPPPKPVDPGVGCLFDGVSAV